MIEDVFRQEYYKSKNRNENNCPLLSLASMMNLFDRDAAMKMVDQIDDPIYCKEFEWMYFLKVPPRMKTDDSSQRNIVNKRLKDSIGYTLTRVGKAEITSERFNKKFLLSKKKQHHFVIGLESDGGFISHAIAIDCIQRLIYDCMEIHVLKFTNKTLNHCVGQDQVRVERIPHCYKLVPLPGKKTYKDRKKKKRKTDEMSEN